ncbi:carboxypeptidase regulatory-like domain-containing protein [Exilibacterium tricleocarpae]|uniref:Carboxypeptidase regulatory-like domain-containing protein n=1 Tax=Exilibacterium tricleocarpae TaxID=2591008 RepID=A0A545U9C8_9GAMM|nr:carboxypeptidase-like regulatory domain-containing protein [Exilibacterium tricleocarpae]TQV86078.1 carboxypeptidase regulatory-like domain-containing protein [Exilibacterium tricleocarpae]
MKKNTYTLCKLLLATLLGCIPLTVSFAGGPLDLNPNDPENFSRWPNGGANIPFNPDLSGLGPLSNAEAVQQTVDAFQRWQDIPTATATYVNAGPLPFDVDVTNFQPFIDNLFNENNNSDGLSPIVYDEDGSIFIALFGVSGILGFASADTFDSNGTPIEGVSFLNGGALNDGFPLEDFFAVQVHEFGHYSGLAHTVINGQNIAFNDATGPSPNNTFGNAPADQVETMYPFAIRGGGQATPHADDIAFYSTLYPAPDFFSTTGSISGTIIAPNGTTPLSGVNVIARNVADPFVDAVSAISGDRGVPGIYTIGGLTPGAEYVLYIDEIIDGGFSTEPLQPLPGPEEFYNGAGESNDGAADDPADSVTITAMAGTNQTGIDVIFNGAAAGVPLPVGDDGFVEVFLPFTFAMCGQDFDSVFINANGNLTFGAPDAEFRETANGLLAGPPRIAGVWDDLNPSAGGSVVFASDPHRFSVSWTDVPEFPEAGANSFKITLKRNLPGSPFGNAFAITYNDLTLVDGISGYSCGSKVTSRFETQNDLSAAAPFILKSLFKTAVFEQFDADTPIDLNGSAAFYVGTRTFRDRFEPNDSLKRARWIHLPFNSESNSRAYTAIAPEGDDVDYYRFYARAGQSLVAEVLTGDIDSVAGLFDSDGNLIAFDDDGGVGALSRLVAEIPANGLYSLAIGTFPDTDFSGDGNGNGRYVLDAFTVNGRVLTLGDDTSTELPLDFSFPFQGQNWDSVFVNSNGNLTFGGGDTAFTESVTGLLNGLPRIAPLWDDLSPNVGGLVIANVQSDTATITFSNVPEFLAATTNTFSVTLNADGSVGIDYGALAATDGIAGVTEGGGAVDPGATDLSEAMSLPASGTTYELFDSDNNNDLAESLLIFD